MARSDDDNPHTAIPEADRLEQDQPANPAVSREERWPAMPTGNADQADRLEQSHPVPTDPDEEYPPNAG
jgi:hypothetical protein